MKYYLDTEFDGHGGPLLSLALVAEDGQSIHIRTSFMADDPWVIENVESVIGMHNATIAANDVPLDDVGGVVRGFLCLHEGLDPPTIIADSVVDIGRICEAISTGFDGSWASFDGDIKFEVHGVACYPTDLPGAVQHNAWWDAMALRHKLSQD